MKKMKSHTFMNYAFSATMVSMIIASAATGVSATPAMSSGPSAKQVIVAKTLISSKRCNGCHGAALAGVQGFSPSLHESGTLAEYNKKTFETVMSTGVTNDGGMVMKPMPIYHMKPAQADLIFAYLKTLK